MQTKLTVSEPGDEYEQEADRVADQVMAMPEPDTHVQRACSAYDAEEGVQSKPRAEQITPLVQRQVEPEDDQEAVQTKSTNGDIQRQEAEVEEGKSILPSIFNRGIGTVDNKTAKTFCANASQGKEGRSQPIRLPPGRWGDNRIIPGLRGEALNDIDFVFPTGETPINGTTDGAFKIGSNDATIAKDPKDPKNSKIDDYNSYWPHDKAKDLVGYPTQKDAEQRADTIQRQAKEPGGYPIRARRIGGQSIQMTPGLEARIHRLGGGGQPLPRSVRKFFESRMGYDFSGVRLHTDSRAEALSKALHARAFTVGANICLRTSEYSLAQPYGRHLLAHELTHVVQQARGRGNFPSSSRHTSVQRLEVTGEGESPQGWTAVPRAELGAAHRATGIVADAVLEKNCIAYFRKNCPGGTPATAENAFKAGRLWRIQSNNKRLYGLGECPGSNVGYTGKAYQGGPMRLAGTIVHELMHNCGTTDEKVCEGALRPCGHLPQVPVGERDTGGVVPILPVEAKIKLFKQKVIELSGRTDLLFVQAVGTGPVGCGEGVCSIVPQDPAWDSASAAQVTEWAEQVVDRCFQNSKKSPTGKGKVK